MDGRAPVGIGRSWLDLGEAEAVLGSSVVERGLYLCFVLFCSVLSIRVFSLVFLHPFQATVPELQILGCFVCISELPKEGFFYQKTPVSWS